MRTVSLKSAVDAVAEADVDDLEMKLPQTS
jgi:hypothetical protein